MNIIQLLIEWVSQIIMFILLAVIIDIFIPRSTLKKYVRLVIGLILILIFLKPVFYLFQTDVDAHIKRARESIEDMVDQSKTDKITFKYNKNEIQATRDAYIVKEITYLLKKEVNNKLINKYGVVIRDINYKFKDNNVAYENLEHITVFIGQAQTNDGYKQIDDLELNMVNMLGNEWGIAANKIDVVW